MNTNPFLALKPWISQILHAIKKDLKTDHLAVNKNFYRTHFGTRPLNKLLVEEIFAVYEKELLAGNEELVEWAVNRWVFKHGDLYQHFAQRLSEINPDFQGIEALTEVQANQILDGAEVFGEVEVYLFSRLNGVVFPETIFERLRVAAEKKIAEDKLQKEQSAVQESQVQELERLRREAARAREKYEDKLAGVQRKYQTETEALKKQICSLQEQLVKR